MLRYLLDFCYLILVLLVLPRVLWQRWRYGKYRVGLSQKLVGRLPRRRDHATQRIWIHAVSVGEVLQLRQIVAGLKAACPNLQILITTTTDTGYTVAQDSLPDCDIAYFPLDFSWAVHRALYRASPDLIVLVELELWPNFINAAADRSIPLMLINGRLSARSFRGYSRIGLLIQVLLDQFKLIAVQTEEYRTRFLELGARPDRTIVTGSIKFDGVATNRSNPKTMALRDWLQIRDDELVFVAGSTQEPEEQYAVDVFKALKVEFPQLRLIVVPRHPERGDSIASLLQKEGLPVARRSRAGMTLSASQQPVGLLDTVGELGACWGLADVAFVGGSFTKRNGQNMLEPAAYGAAVCYGPNTANFRQVVELLEQHNASQRVRSPEELKTFVQTMLRDRQAAQEMGQRAKELVLSQQGATQRTVERIVSALEATQQRDRIAA